MKRLLSLLALASITYGCQTSLPEVSYTTISATLCDSVEVAGSIEYPKQFFRYPQISNMRNKAVQDSLNRRFKLADIDALRADKHYKDVCEVSNDSYPEHGRMYSFEQLRISYIDDEIISYDGQIDYDGGAHPSFELTRARTVALNNLQPVMLNDLFTDNYKSLFKEQILASEQLKNFTSDGIIELNELGKACDDLLDALLAHMDTVSTTHNMLIYSDMLSIVQLDFRDFGCPEYMRGVIEIKIPFEQLKPYIKPRGYFGKFLK